MQSWPAPAKLNLFLHITGQRADGYHTLQTVFQFLDYGDELRFAITEDGRISRTQPVAGIPEASDLCIRAAHLLQAESGTSGGVAISLEKHIPTGGGLGGGSSDAATTLLALNRLWGLNLSRDRLTELGLKLGADVPVFIHGRAVWAEGVGEALTPIELDEPWYLVLAPEVSVSTANVFAQPELTHTSPPITIRAFHEGSTRNDLEPVVRRMYPQVDQVLQWLADFGRPRMTGSGGCAFLETASREEGEQILAQCPSTYRGFVARGINASPLLARLEKED